VLAVLRFVVPIGTGVGFADAAGELLAALSGRPGLLRGQLGRAVDDPQSWILVTEWVGVGDYRRALGTGEVKLASGPVLGYLDPQPSAFEVLELRSDGRVRSTPSDRAEP